MGQPAFTCSKLTIKTLEQGVKYVNWRHKIVHFKPCSSVSIVVTFEHVIAGWENHNFISIIVLVCDSNICVTFVLFTIFSGVSR